MRQLVKHIWVASFTILTPSLFTVVLNHCFVECKLPPGQSYLSQMSSSPKTPPLILATTVWFALHLAVTCWAHMEFNMTHVQCVKETHAALMAAGNKNNSKKPRKRQSAAGGQLPDKTATTADDSTVSADDAAAADVSGSQQQHQPNKEAAAARSKKNWSMVPDETAMLPIEKFRWGLGVGLLMLMFQWSTSALFMNVLLDVPVWTRSFHHVDWFDPMRWSTVHTFLGASVYVIWLHQNCLAGRLTAENRAVAETALRVLFNHFITYGLWTAVMFEAKSLMSGFLMIGLLFVYHAMQLVAFAHVSALATVLYVPYIVWLAWSVYLNTYLLRIEMGV